MTTLPSTDHRSTGIGLPQQAEAVNILTEIRAFQSAVKDNLVENVDYGIIPNTGTKPTLFKSGAEKIVGMLQLIPDPEIISEQTDWEKGLHAFTVRMNLKDSSGLVRGSGSGRVQQLRVQVPLPPGQAHLPRM